MSGAPYTAQPEPRLTLRLTLGDDPAIRGQVEKIVLDLIKSNPDFEFSDSSDLEPLEPSPIYPDHPELAFLARPRTLQISQPSAMGNDDFHAFLIQLLAKLQADRIVFNQSIDFDDKGDPLEASLQLRDLQTPEEAKKTREAEKDAELPSPPADVPRVKDFCTTSPWNRLHITRDIDGNIPDAPFGLRRDCLEADGWSLLEFNAQNQRKIEQINQMLGAIKNFVLDHLHLDSLELVSSAPPAEKFPNDVTGKLYDLDEDSFVKKGRDPRSLDQLYEETKFPVMHGLDEEIFTSDPEYLDRPSFSYLTREIEKTDKQKGAPGAGEPGAGVVTPEEPREINALSQFLEKDLQTLKRLLHPKRAGSRDSTLTQYLRETMPGFINFHTGSLFTDTEFEILEAFLLEKKRQDLSNKLENIPRQIFRLSQLFIQYLLPAGDTAGHTADLADLTEAFKSFLETPGPLAHIIPHLLKVSKKLGDLRQDLINTNQSIATHLIQNAIEAAESYKGLTTSRGLGRHKKFIFEHELIYKILKKNLSEIQLSYLGDSRDYLELTKASFIQWQTRHGHELAHRRFFTCLSPAKHPTDSVKIMNNIAAIFSMRAGVITPSTSGAARGYGSMGSIQQERAKSTAGSEVEMVASGPKPTDDCLTPLLQRK